MIDKTDFSYTFQINQPVDEALDSEVIAFDSCKAYELPDHKVLVRNPRNGKSAVVTEKVFSTLITCDKFQTLDDHTSDLLKKLTEGQATAVGDKASDIKRVLKRTLKDGLMVSASEICRAINSNDSPVVSAKNNNSDKAVVVIITWERPAVLQRLLDSILNNCDLQSL